MADVYPPKKRSAVMSKVRSRGNASTEIVLMAALRAHRFRGWRRHLAMPGTPDFAFVGKKLAVFVDGCFWHGCPKCYRAPKQNAGFWRDKIDRNRRRDRRVDQALRRKGWSVMRVRSCQLAKTLDAVLARLRRNLRY